ncbi:MAG: biotin/lipoate--protein ligase family protein [Pseudomonadota bacterium]
MKPSSGSVGNGYDANTELTQPALPPILTAHVQAADVDVFEAAVDSAASGSLGAADCLWSTRTARAEFAIVLEPDVAAHAAKQMGPLMFGAVADSLGVLMPPKTSVLLRWPSTVLVNGAKAGHINLAIAEPRTPSDQPDPSTSTNVPDWLVVGASIRLYRSNKGAEPGSNPDETVLHEEGGGDLERSQVIQSIAAHFLTRLNHWQDGGFASAHDSIIGRIEGHEQPADIQGPDGTTWAGATVLGISEDAELLIKSNTGEHLALPQFIDPQPDVS